MIVGWALYLFVTAALLAGTGWAVERALVATGRFRRWAWVGAVAATLLLPPIVLLLVQASTGDGVTVLEATGPSLSLEGAATKATGGGSVSVADSGLSGWLSAASPWVGWCWFLSAAVALARCAGAWRRVVTAGISAGQVKEVAVRRTTELGPAVGGWRRPVVLLPDWYFDLDEEDRALVLRHELEHVRADDHRLLWGARLVVALMPWNLPLRWSAARLREAVELDCDRRTLSTGADSKRYGELLLTAQRRGGGDLGRAAWESGSLTGRRIRALVEDDQPSRGAATLAAAGAVLLLLGTDGAVAGAMSSAGLMGESPTFGSIFQERPVLQGSTIRCTTDDPLSSDDTRARLALRLSEGRGGVLIRVDADPEPGPAWLERGDSRLWREAGEIGLAVDVGPGERGCSVTGSEAYVEIGAADAGDTLRVQISGPADLRLEDRTSRTAVVLGTGEAHFSSTTCRAGGQEAIICGDSGSGGS